MEIDELLQKLKQEKENGKKEYIHSTFLSEHEIFILEKNNFSVICFNCKECPCGNWNNLLCNCTWQELQLHKQKNKLFYKIKL